MSAPWRVGVVGCGRVTTTHHVPALAALPAFELVALADGDGARLAEAAGAAGGAAVRTYENHQGLLEDDGVDLVVIAVPTPWHAEVGLATLQAGKHLLLEKPIALTHEDADRLVEAAAVAAESHGSCAAIGFNLRCHRLVERAREIVAAGALGNIQLVRSVLSSGWTPRTLPEWRRRRATGGGALFELAVHHFDLWRLLLGDEIEEISATVDSVGFAAGGETAADDADAACDDVGVAVHGRTREGVLVSGYFSQSGADANEVELFGDRARLRLSLYRVDGLELDTRGAVAGALSGRLGRVLGEIGRAPAHLRAYRSGGVFRESYLRQWEALDAALRRDAAAPASFSDGRAALAVALAAQSAVDQGGWQRVELDGAGAVRPAASQRGGGRS